MSPEEKTMLLKSFIQDYPLTTSADWQTFVLAVERTLTYLDAKNEYELNKMENQSPEC